MQDDVLVNIWSFLCGAAVGAALVYIFEPGVGRRRMMRDALGRGARGTPTPSTAMAQPGPGRDGAQATPRATVAQDGPPLPADDVTAERVCARIGRAVQHAGAVQVDVRSGAVTLTGPVLDDELDALLRAAWSVPGVQQVDNRLSVQANGRRPATAHSGARR